MDNLALPPHAMMGHVMTGAADPSYQLGGIDPTGDDNPLFATNDFRMMYMKVLPCAKRYVHDWTNCPFGHTGEKARRRDPKLYTYTGIACPDMKKTGNCIRGDKCPYAHNVFEYWLHPTRYRTQLCNDGQGCGRKVCFFAHTLDEVRVPKEKPYVSPEALAAASLEAIAEACRNREAGVGGALPDAGGLGGALSSALGGPLGGPAPPNGLYKSYSCPTHVPAFNHQLLRNFSGAQGAPGYPAKPTLHRGGSTAAVNAMLTEQERLHLMAKLQGDASQYHMQQHQDPSLNTLANNVLGSPRSAESQTTATITLSDVTSPATSREGPTGAPAGQNNDADLLQSLVSIKQAIASGKLQQGDIMKLLEGLPDGPTGPLTPAPEGAPQALSPKPSEGAADGQTDGAPEGPPEPIKSKGSLGTVNSDLAAATAAAAAMLSSAPSSSALSDAQELLQNLSLGVPGSPGAPAGAPMPAAGGGSMWHTASAPVLPAGIDPALLAPHAMNAQFMMPTVSEGIAHTSGIPELYARAYGFPGALPGALDDPQQRTVLEELLQHSAATQSSAAANGQASRQAKLAKASSLTNWLQKLMPDN